VFVSVVAWLTLISGCVSLLGAVLTIPAAPSIPAFGALLGGTAALATGVGLRRRRSWARRATMVVLAYAAVAGFVQAGRLPDQLGQQYTTTVTVRSGGAPPTDMYFDGSRIRNAALLGAAVYALFSVLIILRFRSATIRAEFQEDDE
jgi:hypothetical protein